MDSEGIERWGGSSRYVDFDGPVHYVDFGGDDARPAVVLVHGLGGSHLNWCLLAPLLAERTRVLAVDLVGFGLTDPLGRSTTLQANARMISRFLRQVVGRPVILVGNSMGAATSILVAARDPDSVAGLVLIDPALPPAGPWWVSRPELRVAAAFTGLAVPLLGRWLVQRRRRTTARAQVRQVLRLCCVDPTGVPGDLVDASVALVERRTRVAGLDAAFLTAARSLMAHNGMSGRAWSTIRNLRQPVLLLHGEADRLVPVGLARAAQVRCPEWTVDVLPNVGHVPQLEVPDTTAERIFSWLDGPGAAAAQRAGDSGESGGAAYPEGNTRR
ncbi:alpha/beta fold hydrolase [Kribbella sindirgiensis]|uniref:Alpha/beta hydrolase n=1 Tax=Kribbella sindirgiensis TaxID=1124744 RepID=A0A4R0IJ76_9ACTN|nr:alpha/beta hydrolase [Kribbella sindirgiensis]TCC32240.1 alpha/beta hydrolase [Kribbella sindirgiensis]